MKISTACQNFLREKKGVLAEGSITAYGDRLDGFASWCYHNGGDSILNLTDKTVQSFMLWLSGRDRKASTLLAYGNAIRAFCRWAVSQRLIAAIPTWDKPRTPEHIPKPFQPDELQRLMALPLEGQEKALRALLYYGGLRIGTVVALRCEDVDLSRRVIDGVESCGTLHTVGKGSKEHALPMHPALRDEMENFLLSDARLKNTSRFLLTRDDGRPWSTPIIRNRVRRWGQRAQVRHCHAHRFRHTFATNMLEAGAAPVEIQRALNHKSIATTMIYMKVADARVVQAVHRLPSFGANTPAAEPKSMREKYVDGPEGAR